jgi:hypothetical protein
VTTNEPFADTLRDCFAARDETRTADEPCPDPERIWDAANGGLAPDETQRVVDHFAVCPSCAADWRIAASARTAAEPKVVAFPPRRRVAPWAGLAAAAALVVLAVTVIYRQIAPVPTEPVYRATETTIKTLVAEDQVLPREGAVLRWTSAGDDARYSVEVGKTDLTPLASGHDLNVAEFAVPPGALEGLAAGETVVWQVEALLPDGRRIVSEAFVHRVE